MTAPFTVASSQRLKPGRANRTHCPNKLSDQLQMDLALGAASAVVRCNFHGSSVEAAAVKAAEHLVVSSLKVVRNLHGASMEVVAVMAGAGALAGR